MSREKVQTVIKGVNREVDYEKFAKSLHNAMTTELTSYRTHVGDFDIDEKGRALLSVEIRFTGSDKVGDAIVVYGDICKKRQIFNELVSKYESKYQINGVDKTVNNSEFDMFNESTVNTLETLRLIASDWRVVTTEKPGVSIDFRLTSAYKPIVTLMNDMHQLDSGYNSGWITKDYYEKLIGCVIRDFVEAMQ